MSDELQRLEEWVAPLLRQLDAKQRRQLTRRIATDLRRRQQQRIRAQIDPSGRRWPARKPQQLRGKGGFIKRGAMFTKLRTAKYLRLQTDPQSAAVTFLGRAARIADVHHHGRRDRVSKDGPRYDYPERQLLGFGPGDEEWLRDLLIDHLDHVSV